MYNSPGVGLCVEPSACQVIGDRVIPPRGLNRPDLLVVVRAIDLVRVLLLGVSRTSASLPSSL